MSFLMDVAMFGSLFVVSMGIGVLCYAAYNYCLSRRRP